MKKNFDFYKELFEISAKSKGQIITKDRNTIEIFAVSFDITQKDENTIKKLASFNDDVLKNLFKFDEEVRNGNRKMKKLYNHLIKLLGEHNPEWGNYLDIMSAGLIEE